MKQIHKNRVNKLFRNLSMRNRLIIFFIIISVLPTSILGFAAYRLLLEQIRKDTVNEAVFRLEGASKTLEEYFNEIENLSIEVIKDLNVQYLLNNEKNPLSLQYEDRAIRLANYILSSQNSISSLQIYNNSENLVLHKTLAYNDTFRNVAGGGEIFLSNDYSLAGDLKGYSLWSNIYSKYDKLSLIRLINKTATQEKNGLLVINIDKSKLNDIYPDIPLFSESHLIIYKTSGEIYFESKGKEDKNSINAEETIGLMVNNTGEIQRHGNKYIYIKNYSVKYDCYISALIPEAKVFTSLNMLRQIIFTLIFICLILAVCFAMLLGYYMMKPLNLLQNTMETVEAGDLSVRFKRKYNDEINSIGNSFNKMLDNLNDLILQNEEKQRKIRIEEFKALQSQINPHFLYNTMDNIYWHAQTIEAFEICTIVEALSQYYRISLSDGSLLITLENEFSHVRNYLEIQRQRYSNLDLCTLDMASEISNCFIVKLTMQPIVENAIYHGLRDKECGGEIKINAYRDNDYILIKFYDNGKGINKDKIEKLLIQDESKQGGYGLYNVNSRLKIIFGDESGISIESEEWKYTIVTVKIPVIYDKSKYE